MKRWLRILIGLAALLGGGGCAVAALAGQLGRWDDAYDLLNHVSPFWMLGGLLCIILSLAASRGMVRWLGVAIGVVAIVAAGLQTMPVLAQAAGQPFVARAIPGDAPRLKLVQFSFFHENTNPGAAVDWLLAQDADVLVLEEGVGLTGPARDRLLAVYPYRNIRDDMILSRLPMLSGGRLEIPPRPTSMYFAGGYSVIDGPGGPFTLVGIHFTWPWPLRPQATQRREFGRYIASLPRGSTIVSGDFNSTPWSFALQRLERDMGLHRVTHGVITFPANQYRGSGAMKRAKGLPPVPPFAPIDQVFAGSDWRALSVKRGPKLGSDHFPVVVVLARTG